MAEQLAVYVTETGFTHVELLPVSEHPFGGSWGYQVTSYYAPTSRFGTPDDFRWFVDHLHAAGIGVIVDWVPAHFPKDEWALARFDGTPLYEHADPRRGEQLDWGTYVFDFGRREVRNFLVANALFWLEEFHIDGLRVDAVASMLYLDYSRPEGGWTPNIHGGRENLEAVAFLQEMNATVHKNHRGVVTVAEESTAWPGVTRATNVGGLGFNMKWNMGWMHDTLGFLGHDPVHRTYHHHEITFSLMYAWSENYLLPISHDEVVHGKGTLWTRMPGNDFAKASGLRSLLAYMWAHPGKQLLFMGQEFGQSAEWSEERGLDWWQLDDQYTGTLHRGVQRLVGDLNSAYRRHPAMWTLDTSPGGYSWIDANDTENNVLSFLRYGTDGSIVACLFNFSGSEHSSYRVGLPEPGRWGGNSQHRCRGVRRLRSREPRSGHSNVAFVARSASLRTGGAASCWSDLDKSGSVDGRPASSHCHVVTVGSGSTARRLCPGNEWPRRLDLSRSLPRRRTSTQRQDQVGCVREPPTPTEQSPAPTAGTSTRWQPTPSQTSKPTGPPSTRLCSTSPSNRSTS